MNARRATFRKGLSPLYLPYYDGLCDGLADYWQPISGLRSWELQAKLYAQGRTTAGPIVTRAKPGLSFHQYGLASDWEYFPIGEDGVQRYHPLPASHPLWSEYTLFCEKLGLKTLSWERPHNQFSTDMPIRDIMEAYISHGNAGVEDLLKEE